MNVEIFPNEIRGWGGIRGDFNLCFKTCIPQVKIVVALMVLKITTTLKGGPKAHILHTTVEYAKSCLSVKKLILTS